MLKGTQVPIFTAKDAKDAKEGQRQVQGTSQFA
jgi:hypothetical protein